MTTIAHYGDGRRERTVAFIVGADRAVNSMDRLTISAYSDGVSAATLIGTMHPHVANLLIEGLAELQVVFVPATERAKCAESPPAGDTPSTTERATSQDEPRIDTVEQGIDILRATLSNHEERHARQNRSIANLQDGLMDLSRHVNTIVADRLASLEAQMERMTGTVARVMSGESTAVLVDRVAALEERLARIVEALAP